MPGYWVTRLSIESITERDMTTLQKLLGCCSIHVGAEQVLDAEEFTPGYCQWLTGQIRDRRAAEDDLLKYVLQHVCLRLTQLLHLV